MKTPCLTPEIIADDDALALAIQELFLGSKRMRKLTRRVRRAQDRLHGVVDGGAWRVYLRLEQSVNDRASEEVEHLIRWAYDAGKRHGIALGVRLVTCPPGGADAVAE